MIEHGYRFNLIQHGVSEEVESHGSSDRIPVDRPVIPFPLMGWGNIDGTNIFFSQIHNEKMISQRTTAGPTPLPG